MANPGMPTRVAAVAAIKSKAGGWGVKNGPTGGTAAPSGAQRAPNQHAPNPGQAAREKNQRNKSYQAHLRQAAAKKAAAPKPAAAKPGTNWHQGLNPYQEYTTGKYLNANQLAAIARTQAGANEASALQPLQATGKQITGAEGVALGQQAAQGAVNNASMAGIQQSQEASAKTAQNNAADAAVRAQRELQTTAAAGNMANGGQPGAQTSQALNASAAQSAGLAGTAADYAKANATSGTNLISGLRAAAAQRITEGGTRLQQTYGAAQAKNSAAIGTISANRPAAEIKAREGLSREQMADRIAFKNVGLKEGSLSLDAATAAAKVRGEAARNATSENNSKRTAGTSQANSERTAATSRANSQEHVSATLDAANKRAEAAAKNGGVTSAQALKATGELGQAYSTVRQALENLHLPGNQQQKATAVRNILGTGYLRVKDAEGKVTTLKFPKVANQAIVSGAIQLYFYHKVDNTIGAQLHALGLPPEIHSVVGLNGGGTKPKPGNAAPPNLPAPKH